MAAPKHTPGSWEAPMPDITDEKLALIEYDEGEASDDDIAAIIARLRRAEAERDAGRAKVEKLRCALDDLATVSAYILKGRAETAELGPAIAHARAALAETEGSDG